MRYLLFAFLLLIIEKQSTAQTHSCTLSPQTAAFVKERLMRNRASMTNEQVIDLMNKRSITYIPVSFHSISNSSGEGAANEKEIFDFLCGLNALYLDQNIQFFIFNQINFRVSDDIDTDASSTASANTMDNWRIPGSVNIYIGRSSNNATSSWYSYSDYIFLLKSMMSPEAKTEAHEIGHFFTLPHTFYGWEGINVESDYGGQSVPSSIGGGWSQFQPEASARTGGQANCSNAADGFCDTEADYYSSRKTCPYVPTVLDPYGDSINPDETNLMSYALDACVYSFSNEQKTAIAIDVAQRFWATNTPNGTVDLSQEAASTPVSPLNLGQLGPVSDPTLRLDWSSVNGAAWYYLEVYNTIVPGIWIEDVTDPVFKGYLFSSNSFYDLPTNDLQVGKYYAWRVTPLSNYSTCAVPSPFYKFQATTLSTDLKDLPIEQQASFDLIQNPVNQDQMNFKIYLSNSMDIRFTLYSMNGVELINLQQSFYQGESMLQLPASDLTNGHYIAVLRTENGLLHQKVKICR